MNMRYEQPGCFGYAATYSVKSATCSACDSREHCAVEAKKSLDELARVINVDAAIKLMHDHRKDIVKSAKPSRQELTAVQQALVERMSKNAGKLAEFMLLKRINYRQALCEGTNPLKDDAPISISLLFDLMLEGPVTRADYLMALKDRLGQSPSTAASQASIGFQVVKGLGIGRFENECLSIRSNP